LRSAAAGVVQIAAPIDLRIDDARAALVVWGRNGPSFIAPGAEAFKRELPDAEIHLLDADHFALDEKNDEIGSVILGFFAKHSVCRSVGCSTGLFTFYPPNPNWSRL
jgi:hypothetical protein